MTPILRQLTEAEYRSVEGLGSTLVKALLRSAAHYQTLLHELRVPTKGMLDGTMIHAAALERAVFLATYALFDGDARTNAGKAAKQAILEAGKIPVSQDDYDRALRIADILAAHPIVGPLLRAEDAETEGCHFFAAQHTEPGLGLSMPAKMKPDLYVPSSNFDAVSGMPRGFVCDLKTTDDARPEAFARTVENFSYDLQAALYLDGFGSLGLTPDWLWIVVERDAPHGVRVYKASGEHIASGYRKLDIAIERYNACVESGIWPVYDVSEIEELGRPGWAR